MTKTYTVVIDAGHGGSDAGAIGIDGKSQEKDIALSIVKLIKASNRNANINIILTRDNDVFMSPVEKVAVANKANPDIFLSVHCNNNDMAVQANKPLTGIEIFIANKQKAKNYDANYQFAAALSSTLVTTDKIDKGIVTRAKGIWVLQEVNCPSALVECGYMDNKTDLEKLKNNSYQQVMANNILKGIESYFVNKENGASPLVVDTVPKMKGKVEGVFIEGKDTSKFNGHFYIEKNDNFFKKNEYLMPGDTLSIKPIKIEDVPENAVIVYNKNIITKEALDKLYRQSFMKLDLTLIKTNTNIKEYGEAAKDGVIRVRDANPHLIVIDGKEANDNIDNINPNSIKSITVLKDKKATTKYGEKGKNGVIEVELKKEGDALDDGKIFTEVQIPAEFPGGAAAWKKYLERNLKMPEEVKTKNAPSGKYSVELAFMVGEDGGLSNIKALTDPGYGTADAAITLIAKGPKWIPAMQNGKKVYSIKKLTITFLIDEKSVSSSKNPPKQFVATQRILPTELKKFQQVSADISEVYWVGSLKNLFVNIVHINGLTETYDLFDEKNKVVALSRYNQSMLFNCKFLLERIEYVRKSLKS